MGRIIEVFRSAPLRAVVLVLLFSVGVVAATSTTRMMVAGIDLQTIELDGGTYRIERDEGRYGLLGHERITIRPIHPDVEGPRLTYYSHEPSFVTLGRQGGDRDAVIWYQLREPWRVLAPVGTMHAVSMGGDFIFDAVGTFLHRRRIGARLGVVAAVILLGLVPAYTIRLDRLAGGSAPPATRSSGRRTRKLRRGSESSRT